MDAVILANYFNEHAPFDKGAFEKLLDQSINTISSII